MMRRMMLGVACLVQALVVSAENAYDFRRRLEVVHQADRRDPAALRAADEFALALVEEDSHLGFEPDMDYVGGPEQIRWKLKLMEKLYGREAVAEN